MFLSREVRDENLRKFQSLPQILQQMIIGVSVKLESGDRRFTGSGVILMRQASPSVIILTAKHNLWVKQERQDPPGDPPSRLAQNFQDTVNIVYETSGLGTQPRQVASIARISFFGQDSWDYDLMLLRAQDANLFAFADANRIFKNRSDIEAAINFLSQNPFNNQNNAFAQTGFGQTPGSQSSGGPLQLRFSTTLAPLFQNVETGFENQPVYEEVALVSAADDNTTAPGDSGGPLFAVNQNQNLFLMGSNLGANFLPNQVIPPDAPVQNNAATGVLTLLSSLLTG